MIRNFKDSDIFDLEDLHEGSEKNFVFPNYNSPINICKKTILDETGKIVGTCWVHLTAEVGIIIDSNMPTITRAKLIKEVFESQLQDVKKTDLEDVHVFIVPDKDHIWEKFLKENFDFVPDIGLALCRRINKDE